MRRVFKLMQTRCRYMQFKYWAQERRQITDRLQSITLKSYIYDMQKKNNSQNYLIEYGILKFNWIRLKEPIRSKKWLLSNFEKWTVNLNGILNEKNFRKIASLDKIGTSLFIFGTTHSVILFARTHNQGAPSCEYQQKSLEFSPSETNSKLWIARSRKKWGN